MTNVQQILDSMSLEDKAVMTELRSLILTHLPSGFEEQVSYGMIGFVVPHALYAKGYHVDPKLPLPFMAIARQKKAYSLYHMGLYGDPQLMAWFTQAYKARFGRLDHGKSCLRFKTKEKIPFELIGILCEKISAERWIALYEANLSKPRG